LRRPHDNKFFPLQKSRAIALSINWATEMFIDSGYPKTEEDK
jgi:hypothetical protein